MTKIFCDGCDTAIEKENKVFTGGGMIFYTPSGEKKITLNYLIHVDCIGLDLCVDCIRERIV